MKRIKVDSTDEKMLIMGMITNTRYLREVQTVFNYQILKSDYVKKISRWCIEYYKKHKNAPENHIQDIFNEKVENEEIDEDEAIMIAGVLDQLSKDYKYDQKQNTDFLLKRAEKYFLGLDLNKLGRELKDLSQIDIEKAYNLLEHYEPKLLPTTQGVKIFKDKKIIRKIQNDNTKPLFKLPGAIGETINKDLNRESFIAFMGREKIGKTWLLMELAMQAVLNRLNVIFVQAGDMSESQQLKRIHTRINGRPNIEKYCGKIFVPVLDCEHNQFDECNMKKRKSSFGLNVKDKAELEYHFSNQKNKKIFIKKMNNEEYIPCIECKKNKNLKYKFKGAIWYEEKYIHPYSEKDCREAYDKYKRLKKGHDFVLFSHPNNTLTITGLKSNIERYIETNDKTIDVLILDYADLIVSENNRFDFRHQQNQIWKDLRAIAQIYNCLVITATQADSKSYNQYLLNLSNFSEDKRKYSHVTSMYSLNQLSQEKIMGQMRIATLLSRDDDYDINRQVAVLQNFNIGKAIINSYFL